MSGHQEYLFKHMKDGVSEDGVFMPHPFDDRLAGMLGKDTEDRIVASHKVK